jgi:DNA invertase Pin-like site-specific DNA recombinase
MSPKKVAGAPIDIYVRVSQTKGRSGESFQSPAQQEQRCRAQLAADGLTVGEVLIDLDESGGKTSRPAFDRALARARSGESGGVIVHDLTRFGRYATMAQDIIDLEEHGALFISCAEKIDTSTSSGRFFLRVMEAMAVMYREQVGERFIDSKTRAVARGVHISRDVPPGYKRGPDGRLVRHPKHGKTITKAYEMAAGGAAPTDVAKYLTAQGLPSGKNENAVWRSSRIKRLLANRAYLGEARAGKDIRNPNAHEPLTDEATWLRAQRQPTMARVRQDSNALLAGLVRCAGCRRSMKQQAAGGRAPRTYRCPANNSNATHSCPHPATITADKLEDLVFEEYAVRVFDKPSEPIVHRDPPELVAAIAEAKAAVAQAQALDLPQSIREAAVTAALAELDTAEAALAAHKPQEIDIAALAEANLPYFYEEFARIQAGGRVLEGLTEDAAKIFRYGMGKEIAAIWIRPPAADQPKNSRNIADRVKITWRDSEEQYELPVRGTHKDLAPVEWEQVA